jgi:hypothetical protein
MRLIIEGGSFTANVDGVDHERRAEGNRNGMAFLLGNPTRNSSQDWDG